MMGAEGEGAPVRRAIGKEKELRMASIRIPFAKMNGAGNDFVLVDNRNGLIPNANRPALAKAVCHRTGGVGADGLILIEKDPEFDFRWDFYNSDGSSAEMCGNGARCAVRFANAIGAAGETMTFRTLAGPIRGFVTPDGARVQLTDATLPRPVGPLTVEGGTWNIRFLNTGVPHAVVPVDDLETVDVNAVGRALRHHEAFAPKGTNVNFMARRADGEIAIRTYERGVEGETLACGTGSVASAVAATELYGFRSPVGVLTRGGWRLGVSFKMGRSGVTDVFLEGPADRTFEGAYPWATE